MGIQFSSPLRSRVVIDCGSRWLMRLTQPVVSTLVIVGSLTVSTAVAADSAPFVAGFERFARPKAMPSERAGRLLLGELNCVSCHAESSAESSSAESSVVPKSAPRLKGIGQRVSPGYLVQFLQSPAEHLQGSTMPSMLGSIPEERRQAVAESLTDYLVSADGQSFKRQPPDEAAVERGRILYHQTGCIACHDRVSDEPSEALTHSRQFPNLTNKYSFEGLRRFLSNPLEIRPSGRMPHMRLAGRDTADIAHFLLRKTRVPGHLKYELSYGRATLDDREKVTLFKTGLTDEFSLKVAERTNDYFLTFRGFLKIDKPGEYTFRIKADEGARLTIDGQKVAEVENGTRGRSTDRRRVTLAKGWLPIRLDYFQRGRDAILELTWTGPGFEEMSIPATRLRATADTVPVEPGWIVNSDRVNQGRRQFEQLQCHTCHEGPDGQRRQAAAADVPGLNALNPGLGCLGPETTRKTCPDYGLDDLQVDSIQAALKGLVASEPGRAAGADPNMQIDSQMTRLNCYACHERSDVGGVSDQRNPLFTANEIDLGDEGRLPPGLTGVGDKLKPEWLHAVLKRGESVRPYMRARMPIFGESNVEGLAESFIKVDRKTVELPRISSTGEAARVAGRTLTGKGRLNCIGCHMFNGHKLAGIQFMDLTNTTDRLNEDWFYRYLLNPAEFRPGTRMPTAWPNGNALFDDVLEGKTDEQIRALWTYLSDGSRAVNPEGLVPRNLELVVGGRAVIYRNKLWEAGWRGIAVGHPEHLNMAFDAESMRLALLWKGDFLNVTAHWGVQGMGRIRPNGFDVLKFPQGPPLAMLETDKDEWPEATGREAGYRFRGYSLGELDRPTFEYEFHHLSVRDSMTVKKSGGKESFERTLNVKAPKNGGTTVWIRLWEGEQISRDAEIGFRCGEKLRIGLDRDAVQSAVLRNSAAGQELILPVTVGSDWAAIKVGYEW